MSNPYVPMDVPIAPPAGGAAMGSDGAAAGGLAGTAGGKAPSSSDPQYAQFSSTDYDQNYNQQGYNQYNQVRARPACLAHELAWCVRGGWWAGWGRRGDAMRHMPVCV